MLKNLYGWKEDNTKEEYAILSALFGDKEARSTWDECVTLLPKIINIVEHHFLKNNGYISFDGYSLSISFHSDSNETISDEIRNACTEIDDLILK